MTKTKKVTKRRRGQSASKAMLGKRLMPNYLVESGDLSWTGYAATDKEAIQKALESFEMGYLSTMMRIKKTSKPFMYIATESAIDLVGMPTEIA